ncbi:uncharacterized protein LOC141915303 [Tubulanus polymorphus]|uniref:uncharacterized protein LOC141915303 n=1 Tax=Tubulanus polymorphus TaxID=672921 RepID=UPI003DA6B8C6
MKGADIVIGWVHDGKTQIYDMHGVGNSIPKLDKVTNWKLLNGKEENGFTQLTFSRHIDTCDNEGDLPIESGAQTMIYAYGGDVDPVDVTKVFYHGVQNRGAASSYLLDDPPPSILPETDIKTWDIPPSNTKMPATRTTYLCRIVKIDPPGGKKHIIKVEQLLKPRTEQYVHHMTLWRCKKGVINHALISKECFHEYNKNIRQNCFQGMAFFAMGTSGDVLASECYYNTLDRNNVTLSGYTSQDEMCYLDPEKKYLLEWKYEQTERNGSGKVTFRVTVQTTGYVGFGLSRNGGMKGADIVIGWVHDGKTQIYDMHGVGNSIPKLDKVTNWKLLNGKEENGFTQLTFCRHIDTCDNEGDLPIESGAQTMIYAYGGDVDPVDVTKVFYHGVQNRGAASSYLLDDPPPSILPETDIKTWDIPPSNLRQSVAFRPYRKYFIEFVAHENL